MSSTPKISGITRKLFLKAKRVRGSAHAPYSRFMVGAAALDSRGKIYVGCNVENSSYGATICAERSAISAMVADGGREVVELVVVTDTPDGCSPCGVCRQVIAEFSKRRGAFPLDTVVRIANLKSVVKSFKIRELLPEAFDRSFLKRA